MYEYHVTVVAPVPRGEPRAYSMAPRTVPTLLSRFTNSLPPEQNDATLMCDTETPAADRKPADYRLASSRCAW